MQHLLTGLLRLLFLRHLARLNTRPNAPLGNRRRRLMPRENYLDGDLVAAPALTRT